MTDPFVPDQFPPKSCSMTELKHLDLDLTVPLMLRRNFMGVGPTSTVSWGRVMNYVRLVDALVRLHRQTRENLLLFVNDKTNAVYAPLFVAMEYAELSVITMVRAINLVRNIRKDLKGPKNVPRKVFFLTNDGSKSIFSLRNAIEHIDGDLKESEWTQGMPLAIQLKSDRMEFPNVKRVDNADFITVTYADFESWISELWEIAKLQLDYVEPT